MYVQYFHKFQKPFGHPFYGYVGSELLSEHMRSGDLAFNL